MFHLNYVYFLYVILYIFFNITFYINGKHHEISYADTDSYFSTLEYNDISASLLLISLYMTSSFVECIIKNASSI